MKQKLWTTLFLAMATSYALAQATSYAGGDGTKDNPYLISNADELAKLANDVNTVANSSRGRYFKLTQDIVINADVLSADKSKLSGGTAFPKTPMIGSYASETSYMAFQGTLDGDGHAIKGFYQQESANYLALFRVTEGATIKNVRIDDSYTYSNANSSALVGRAIDSRIINCAIINSSINSYGSYIGTLVGQAIGSTKIQNCYATCTISCKNNAGGIVGRIGNGDENNVLVENCYAAVTITTQKGNRGGVTSENSVGSTIRNCYFISTLPRAVWSDKGTTENCEAKTAEEMATADFTALLNGNAQQIGGACQWTTTETSPVHNYTEVTPDDSERAQETLATDPIPADKNLHANADGGTVNLTWTLPLDGKTVSQRIFFGTDEASVSASDAVPTATIGLENTYQMTGLNTKTVYYWRVDRVDADGKAVMGDVWSFQPRQLAFPEAEGYGRFARGGRGGKVVYVTNLNDSGEGSLRWALTNGSGPRTVMFKVSGIIDMNFKSCWIDDFVTVAGQSAPGKGICLKHSDIGVGSDNIVRHLRARRGLGTSEQTGNAIGTVYSDHCILDHVTASWGTDETFSSRGSRNITFQNSMISEALGIAGHRNYDEGTNHGYAATIGGDIGSFHHNLLADCYGRNWSMGGGTDANGEYAGRLDIFNNVVYNWGSRTTDGGAHEVNFVGNYYKCGPANANNFLFSLDIEGNLKGTQSAYISGNIRDNSNGTLTEDKEGVTYRMNIRDGRPSVDWEYFVKQPFFPSYAKIETAQEAYKRVLSDVGANQPIQDLTDQRIISETLNRTYTYVGSKSGIKGEIDNEMDAGGFEDYPETAWADNYDTDMDGLPDWWEEMRGLNVSSPAQDFSDSNTDSNGDGYTELEDYLDFLAQPHVILPPAGTTNIDMKTLFAGYTNSPVFTAESNSTAVTATIANGSMLTINAADTRTLATVTMSVKDADNATYERRFCVAVTDHASTGISALLMDSPEMLDSPIYDLQGRRVTTTLRPGIYIQNKRKFIIR